MRMCRPHCFVHNESIVYSVVCKCTNSPAVHSFSLHYTLCTVGSNHTTPMYIHVHIMCTNVHTCTYYVYCIAGNFRWYKFSYELPIVF